MSGDNVRPRRPSRRFDPMAFALEGINRMAFLFIDRPNAGDEYIYVVRLVSYLLILAAIANKNRARP